MGKILAIILASYAMGAVGWVAWVLVDCHDGDVNWQTAFSLAEVAVSLGSISGLLIAIRELNEALKRPGPELRLSAKCDDVDTWEVILWNVGGEPAQGVRVWIKHTVDRAASQSPPAAITFEMDSDEWKEWRVDASYTAGGSGWEASHHTRLVYDLPRYRGHAVVLRPTPAKGLLEVTARTMNALAEVRWSAADGEVAPPKEAGKR